MPPALRSADDGAAALDTAYTLTLLGEYAYTLDSLPSELARHFADLRELDAVLAGNMAAITEKVVRLTAAIEAGDCDRAVRRRLLADLAGAAAGVKPGAEDKIRVAGLCADALKASALHMAAVLDSVPGREYEGAVLSLDTVYPHVDPEGSNGYSQWKASHKRNALAVGHAIIDSPTKKRRMYTQDDDMHALTRSPRKDKTVARNGARGGKKYTLLLHSEPQPHTNSPLSQADRAPSPSESVLSITSHTLPPSARLPPQTLHRAPSNTSAKRARSFQHDPLPYPAHPHPSLPAPEWPYAPQHAHAPPPPALPRGATQELLDEVENVDGDEEDHGLYCICQKQSYGEMVGCDDDGCEYQWFHLPCLGMTAAPEGTWYCDACTAKRQKSRGGRGGKRKGPSRAKNDR